MRDERPQFPIWLGGVLLALILIFISTRGGGVNNDALIQRFAPRPADPGAPTAESFQLPQVDLPELPPEVQRSLVALRDRLAGGQAVPALTPVASGPRVRVEVEQIQRNGEHLRITGSITNISDEPLVIPASAFIFRDSAGVTYTMSGGDTNLGPGTSTPFNLGVPLPDDRGLTLVVSLPPDPALEQVLLVETKG